MVGTFGRTGGIGGGGNPCSLGAPSRGDGIGVTETLGTAERAGVGCCATAGPLDEHSTAEMPSTPAKRRLFMERLLDLDGRLDRHPDAQRFVGGRIDDRNSNR